MRFVAVLVLLAACGSDSSDGMCDPPSSPDYSCSPFAPGSTETGCSGGPRFNQMEYDPDERFPVDCTVELPMCTPEFPNEVLTCTCVEFGDDVPGWICPI